MTEATHPDFATTYDQAMAVKERTLTDAYAEGRANPYADAFAELGDVDDLRYDTDAFMRATYVRNDFVRWFSWAIPNDRALEAVAGPSREVVEIGAGGGYWAKLLRDRGVRVHAYDHQPGENQYVTRLWSPVKVGGPDDAARHPDATLFLCWSASELMSDRAVQQFQRVGGKRIVVIGEENGATGEARTLKRLEYADLIAIPRWPGLHDYLYVYEL